MTRDSVPMDRRPKLSSALRAFGVPVTVTPVGGEPVETTGIWHGARQEEFGAGGDFGRREPVRLMSIPREPLPTLPRGSTVVAAEQLGKAQGTWQVDGIETMYDHYRALLVPIPKRT